MGVLISISIPDFHYEKVSGVSRVMLDQSFWDLRAPTGLQAPLPDRVASVCAYGFQVGLAPTETIEHAIRDSDLLVAMPCDIIMWTTDGIF